VTEPTDRRCEPAELANMLRGLLATVNAGDVAASTTYRHRLEGAVVALEMVAGGEVDEIVERLAAV